MSEIKIKTPEISNSTEKSWSPLRKKRFARTIGVTAAAALAVAIPVTVNTVNNVHEQELNDLKPSGEVITVEQGDGEYNLVDRLFPEGQEDRQDVKSYLEDANKDIDWAHLQPGINIDIPVIVERMIEEDKTSEK